LHDPKDGKIHHMHHVITLENATKSDPQQIEQDAIDNAKKLGHNTDYLKVLHIQDFKDPRSTYRVDVEKKALIKMSKMNLSEILKNREKRKGGEGLFSLFYLFCPGGADPAGFWFSLSCVNPSPEHVGC
jgi:hypothetical protein